MFSQSLHYVRLVIPTIAILVTPPITQDATLQSFMHLVLSLRSRIYSFSMSLASGGETYYFAGCRAHPSLPHEVTPAKSRSQMAAFIDGPKPFAHLPQQTEESNHAYTTSGRIGKGRNIDGDG